VLSIAAYISFITPTLELVRRMVRGVAMTTTHRSVPMIDVRGYADRAIYIGVALQLRCSHATFTFTSSQPVHSRSAFASQRD